MMEKIIEIQEKIDSRIMRERALILISILAVVFMLWNFIIQVPFDKKALEAGNQLNAMTTQKAALQTQILAATQMLMNDPNRLKKMQLAQLQADMSTMDAQLQTASQSLMKADLLPLALQEVLQKTTQLTLLEVSTYAARELQSDELSTKVPAKSTQGAIQNSAKGEAKSAGVFQHAVTIRVSGNYFQIMQFIQSLEKLPWRFYWQSLDYQVKEYPTAEMILKVYTLSLEEGLLGV